MNIFLLITFSILTSCAAQKNPVKEGLLQGVIGIYEGNCMPGPGRTPCQPKPLSTTIIISQLTEVYAKDLEVKRVRSNENGEYSVALPIGEYSLFLMDGDQVVCTRIECPTSCVCSPFKILIDSTTNVNANLDHAVW